MPACFTSHQAASLHECLSSQLWQGLHSPSRAGAYWSLLDPPGCLLKQNSLWLWEGCQLFEKWHQVCTSTSTWSLRNCSPDYLVLPSAWTGWVVHKGMVDKELLLAVLKVFVAQVLFRQQVGQTQVGFAYLCSWKASCPNLAAICAFCLQPSACPH